MIGKPKGIITEPEISKVSELLFTPSAAEWADLRDPATVDRTRKILHTIRLRAEQVMRTVASQRRAANIDFHHKRITSAEREDLTTAIELTRQHQLAVIAAAERIGNELRAIRAEDTRVSAAELLHAAVAEIATRVVEHRQASLAQGYGAEPFDLQLWRVLDTITIPRTPFEPQKTVPLKEIIRDDPAQTDNEHLVEDEVGAGTGHDRL